MHTKRLTGFRNSFLSPNLDIHSSFSFLDLCNFRHFLKGEDGGGERECCINPNRLVSITVKLLAQDHGENATLQKPRKQKHVWMIFDDRANIKFLTNSGFSCPDLVQVTIYGPKALTWLVCFPNSKAKSYDFLPAKTCQRPPEPWWSWLSTFIKIIFVSRKKKSPGEDCSMAVRRCGVSNVKLQGWWPHLESILSPWAHMTCAPWACWVNLRGGGLSSWSSYWICDGGAVRWCHDSNWSILLLSQRWKSKQSHFLLSGHSMIMPIRCMMLRSYLEHRFWRSFQVPAIQHRQSM